MTEVLEDWEDSVNIGKLHWCIFVASLSLAGGDMALYKLLLSPIRTIYHFKWAKDIPVFNIINCYYYLCKRDHKDKLRGTYRKIMNAG